jgi:uncharacterized RDD family membrane protein YckC
MPIEEKRPSPKGPPKRRATRSQRSSGHTSPTETKPAEKGFRPTRPEPVKRIAAGLMDGIPAYLIAFIPFLGGLISAAYLAIRDGLPLKDSQGQSLGKRLLGLRAVRLPDGEPCDYVTSILRNLPFAVPALIMMRPGMGWVVGSLIWGAVFLVEVLLIIADEKGERLGDRLAKTSVVEVSEKD